MTPNLHLKMVTTAGEVVDFQLGQSEGLPQIANLT